eukprot:gene9439-12753_t
MIRRAFEVISDIPTRLICFSDDVDGMRKVPENVPQQDMLRQHMQKPLTSVPDPYGEYESFGHHNNAMLRRATRKIGQYYDDVLAPSGLKATQQGLLYHIHISDEPAMGAIAAALIMDLSALGHTLKPLIRDGYVETFADPADRRVKRVRLTPQGLAKLDEVMKLWHVAQQRFEAVVGKDQAERLRATLGDIAELDFDLRPAN